MSLEPQSPQKIELSIAQRLKLIDALNRLPLSQLLQIEIALAIPENVMPGLSAEQGERTARLLRFCESPQGMGLGTLLDVLEYLEIKPFGNDANLVDSRNNNNDSRRLKIKLDADISELDRDKVKALLTEIQQLAGNFSIEMSNIKSGSIEIELEGPEYALEKLKQLIDSGQITQVADLQIEDTTFTQAEPQTEGLNLQFANLSSADLRHADLNKGGKGKKLIGATLRHANLTHATLRHANLTHVNLTHANLSGADLSGADLSGATINDETQINSKWRLVHTLVNAGGRRRNLSGADLSGANLRHADLSSADLNGADLSSTDLRGADLRHADLSSANLIGADVTSAIFGVNQGLSEENKADLRNRGAIFQDDPGSPVSDFVRR